MGADQRKVTMSNKHTTQASLADAGQRCMRRTVSPEHEIVSGFKVHHPERAKIEDFLGQGNLVV